VHARARVLEQELALGAADPFLPPRGGYRPLPYFFLTTHSLFFRPSRFFLAARQVRRRYSTTLPASLAMRPRRQRWRSQVRASAGRSAQRAPPVIFLKDLSEGEARGEGGAGAEYGGAEGSPRREGIPRTREAGRPLETPRACFARILLPWTVVLLSKKNSPTRAILLKDDSPSSLFGHFANISHLSRYWE